MKTMVLALGGNALGNSATEQKERLLGVSKVIADLLEEGHRCVISHGNGPQVGMINLAFEESNVDMPFPECGAMSQGYIGYHMQNALINELKSRKMSQQVVSLVTQVQVNPADPAFQNPTKPIGAFAEESELAELKKAHPDYIYKEDAGRGYRRVVPSPLPIDIIEKALVRNLVSDGHVIIACGGGGIPVVEKDGNLEGVAAVIDKDFASALMADLIGADTLVILTAVEKVAINFGSPEQEDLSEVTVAEMEKHIADGMFAPGSMLPKVEAALKFIRGGEGRQAIITSLEKAQDALSGKTGTIIRAE